MAILPVGTLSPHEVGHHVQKLASSRKFVNCNKRDAGGSKPLICAYGTPCRLFCRCLGHSMQQQGVLETGDLEEALNAAQAIGDDRLQQQSQGE